MARILLVEDDIDVRPLLEHVLTIEANYEVTAVECVASALALLERQLFDLVITDVNLPDGSGLTIADKAKELGVRALVFTGHGRNLRPGEIAHYNYLLKPLHVNTFLEAVRLNLRRDDEDSAEVMSFPKG